MEPIDDEHVVVYLLDCVEMLLTKLHYIEKQVESLQARMHNAERAVRTRLYGTRSYRSQPIFNPHQRRAFRPPLPSRRLLPLPPRRLPPPLRRPAQRGYYTHVTSSTYTPTSRSWTRSAALSTIMEEDIEALREYARDGDAREDTPSRGQSVLPAPPVPMAQRVHVYPPQCIQQRVQPAHCTGSAQPGQSGQPAQLASPSEFVVTDRNSGYDQPRDHHRHQHCHQHQSQDQVQDQVQDQIAHNKALLSPLVNNVNLPRKRSNQHQPANSTLHPLKKNKSKLLYNIYANVKYV